MSKSRHATLLLSLTSLCHSESGMYNASMNWFSMLLDWVLPIAATILISGILLWGLRRAIPDEPATRVIRQLVSVALVIFANIALVLALPFESSTTGQLLSLFGLVVTAVIALSSTTFVSNAMAGFMLRSVGGYWPGDFIRVGEHFGRVTEKGLLHTEIQSEDRDLITLPNLFIMTQPVRVVRSSGTLVSADVSLGYGIHRHRVRDLLKQAALDAELADPFVQITNLGDHAVSYRVHGFLEDVNNLVTKRTDLRGKMLDCLHAGDVEVVSPSFMNQRRIDPNAAVGPARNEEKEADDGEDSHAERLMFDKAELAARVTDLRTKRDELKEEMAQLAAEDTDDAGAALRDRDLQWRERQIEHLTDIIETLENK